jgi:hypothetical protein
VYNKETITTIIKRISKGALFFRAKSRRKLEKIKSAVETTNPMREPVLNFFYSLSRAERKSWSDLSGYLISYFSLLMLYTLKSGNIIVMHHK